MPRTKGYPTPTPGPWRVSDFERRAGGVTRHVMGADDFAVAYLDGRSAEEHEANARLIAAAPEMLAALKEQHEAIDILLAMLIQRDQTFMPSRSVVWPKLLQGRAAIEKAEGKGQADAAD